MEYVRRALDAGILNEDGERQCLALTDRGERCKHRVGPDQIVCDVHMITADLDHHLRGACRRRVHSMLAALDQIASGCDEPQAVAEAVFQRVHGLADETHARHVRRLERLGWSRDEIGMISRKER